jgi:uncharacterized protein YdeI (YjbR/CyaY-like superfamily)
MSTRDPRVDAYIAQAGEFARPILTFLREAVHKGCPEIVETMKWSAPFFMRKAILCNMAAFKAHCSFGFWKNGAQVLGKDDSSIPEGMGQFGRIASLKDLPSEKILIGYVKKAVEFDEGGQKRAAKRTAPKAKPPAKPPQDLVAPLQRNKKARETFDQFSPSHQREYIEWITEAKRAETREKRLVQTTQWLTEGKPRHWKYQNC